MFHTMYLLLLIFSIVNSLETEYIKMMSIVFPEKEFGSMSAHFGEAYVIFAAITSVHLLFSYNSYHDMDVNRSKYMSDYPNWYNTWIERILRHLAFIFLLIGVGKISYFNQLLFDHVRNGYTPGQYIMILGSSLFFLFAIIWDVWGAYKCHKWKEHKIFIISDGLALFFWSSTAVIILGGYKGAGVFAFFPIAFLGIYLIVIVGRIGTSLRTWWNKSKVIPAE